MPTDTKDNPKLSELIADVVPHIPAEKMAALLSHPAAQDIIDAAGQAAAKAAGIDTIANPNNSTEGAGASMAQTQTASPESQAIADKVLQERAAAAPKSTPKAEDSFLQMLEGVGDLVSKQLVHGYNAAKDSIQKATK